MEPESSQAGQHQEVNFEEMMSRLHAQEETIQSMHTLYEQELQKQTKQAMLVAQEVPKQQQAQFQETLAVLRQELQELY